MSCSVAISSSAYRHGGVLTSNILVRVMATGTLGLPGPAHKCNLAPAKFSIDSLLLYAYTCLEILLIH